MRDRSLPEKVEFGQNSEFIPSLVLVLFGQKCTPIAKILLLMKRSAVSGCACTTQKKTSLPKWVTTCWLYCSLLLLFATHLFPFFQVWPMPFSLGIQSEDIFLQMYNYVEAFFSPVLAWTGEVRLWMQCWFMFGKTRLRSGIREVAYGKPKFAEPTLYQRWLEVVEMVS